MPEFAFDQLRRWPDVEAPNLFAVDASDRLVLDEAAPLIAASSAGSVAVIGDRYGALTLGALALGAREVRVHQDGILGERALIANAERLGFTGGFTSRGLDAGLLEGARVVLLQLPRALAELDEWADAVARHAAPDVVLVAGGRIKHMTPAMNGVLATSFGNVSAGLARQKSRTLTATDPRADLLPGRFPMAGEVSDEALPSGGLALRSHGAVFAGASLDVGTRFLLSFLPRILEGRPRDAVDLGSGSGVLAAALALAAPELSVIAVDQSAAAVRSSAATASANGAEQVQAVREDALFDRPSASADLIVCNPPFHSGATVHADVALRMLSDAARVLRPGGRLWVVYNNHLGYASALKRIVGPTEVVGRNTKFTVTVSRSHS